MIMKEVRAGDAIATSENAEETGWLTWEPQQGEHHSFAWLSSLFSLY